MTIDEAVSTRHRKYLIMAGGTDCLAILKNKILPSYPDMLLNIKSIPDLSYIKEIDGGLQIGALTSLREIADSSLTRDKYPVLADAARSVGSPQIRNMGTLGGNLCQDTRCWYYRSSPLSGRSYNCYRKGGRTCFAVAGENRYHAVFRDKKCFAVCPSDTAVALSALDATINIHGPRGNRSVPINQFYSAMGNALRSHEIITDVTIPSLPSGTKQTFIKFRLRKSIDFAVVSTATIIVLDKEGNCRDARIALGAVAAKPLRAEKAEELLRNNKITAETSLDAARLSTENAAPLSMNAYKVEIVKALIRRAILL